MKLIFYDNVIAYRLNSHFEIFFFDQFENKYYNRLIEIINSLFQNFNKTILKRKIVVFFALLFFIKDVRLSTTFKITHITLMH